MKICRGGGLLRGEQGLQRGLLAGAALQDQHDTVHGQIGWSRALVELRARQRVRVPGKCGEPREIHSIRHARGDGAGLRESRKRRDERQRARKQSGPAKMGAGSGGAESAHRSQHATIAAHAVICTHTHSG